MSRLGVHYFIVTADDDSGDDVIEKIAIYNAKTLSDAQRELYAMCNKFATEEESQFYTSNKGTRLSWTRYRQGTRTSNSFRIMRYWVFIGMVQCIRECIDPDGKFAEMPADMAAEAAAERANRVAEAAERTNRATEAAEIAARRANRAAEIAANRAAAAYKRIIVNE